MARWVPTDGRSSEVRCLNLFSDTPGAFTETVADHAIMLASFASVAVTALNRGEDADSLRRGLASSREIGQAVGLLMALHRVSDDEPSTFWCEPRRT